MQPLAEEQIMADLVKILKDLTSDWDIDNFDGAISGQTKLVADLSFESIELVQLMVAIEQHFKIKNLASEKLLMKDGRYVADLSVAEIARFLATEIKAR
jgi:acyl carrier protein